MPELIELIQKSMRRNRSRAREGALVDGILLVLALSVPIAVFVLYALTIRV